MGLVAFQRKSYGVFKATEHNAKAAGAAGIVNVSAGMQKYFDIRQGGIPLIFHLSPKVVL